MSTSHVSAEIASQPQVWREAARLAAESAAVLPQPGERVAIVGCGTSWFIAQAYAARREELGQGVTDAFAGSEYPVDRDYDRVVAITRSGTTTEILHLLDVLGDRQRTLAIVGDPTSPGARAADDVVVMPFADEQSVVQTRFATAALTLLRAGLGDDVEALSAAAEDVVGWQVPEEVLARTQFTFLGRGMAVGLANEAGLKMREASLAWAESYPAMDYRHGPISISDETSAVFLLGPEVPGLVEDVSRTGALVVRFDEDAQITLVRCQLLAVANAERKGLDPDAPRHLTRSIILADVAS
ncbi:SIS domain-containing protein [Oerskovia turbata]|uniref:SIS domain-containing protein n=1 Tax=Oerskovia turbata TaxID=1713 RepID=A0A4Q1L072_9CELL|nr:SIS domain-containing protein [Oerskovia turbata]RXR27311.1 SIS domain-containing protein [Oerskovia turbata]RXR36115.1 SIS domain-containing protein [Oerskovia turbata]TGJ94951.1 SIS domain-containing protein [Actinotalea fermentans ATCC 43279 = JCM 9966 = DSM 3133]